MIALLMSSPSSASAPSSSTPVERAAHRLGQRGHAPRRSARWTHPRPPARSRRRASAAARRRGRGEREHLHRVHRRARRRRGASPSRSGSITYSVPGALAARRRVERGRRRRSPPQRVREVHAADAEVDDLDAGRQLAPRQPAASATPKPSSPRKTLPIPATRTRTGAAVAAAARPRRARRRSGGRLARRRGRGRGRRRRSTATARGPPCPARSPRRPRCCPASARSKTSPPARPQPHAAARRRHAVDPTVSGAGAHSASTELAIARAGASAAPRQRLGALEDLARARVGARISAFSSSVRPGCSAPAAGRSRRRRTGRRGSRARSAGSPRG